MLLSWLRLESRCYNSGFCFGAVHAHMHRGMDAAVTQSDDTDRMERKTTPAETAATSEGGTLFVCGRVAVGASVCGVVGKHGSGRLLGWLDAKQLINRGFLSPELSARCDLDLELAIRWRVLTPVRHRRLPDSKSVGCCRLRAVVLKYF